MQGDSTHGQHRPPNGIGVGALFSRYIVLDLWPGMGTEGKKGPVTPELGGFISSFFLNAYSTNLRTGGKLRVPLVKGRRYQNPGLQVASL